MTGPQNGVLSYFRFNESVHSHEKPFEIMINLPTSTKTGSKYRRTNIEFEDHVVKIEDVRGRESDFSLNKNGVCWREWSGPDSWGNLTMNDVQVNGDSWIREQYVKEIENYIKTELERQDGRDLDFVKVFDYRLRTSDARANFESRTVDLYNGLDAITPAVHPHIDQSYAGALGRLRLELPDDAERLAKRRFRIVNVWKPLKVVENWPLAVCDTRTVNFCNLIASDLVRRNFVLESYYAMYDPQQRWYYLSNQQPEEVTFLKIFDSNVNLEARFSLHTSFEIDGGSNAARESLEVRALVFDLA